MTAATIPNAFTVDVEDYFQVGVFQDRLSVAEWDGMESRIERNLDRCRALLDRHSVRATFFVLGWIAERHPAAIAALRDDGHEIGSHGHGHVPIWNQSEEEFAADVERANDAIAGAVGTPPTIYRAPCFSIVPRTLWALDVLHELGFQRDSSIFPVAHPEYGLPTAPHVIHRIELPRGGAILEFPMTVGRFLGRVTAFCGGGWFRLFPYAVSRARLREVEDSGRPFVFYIHPWELDPDQPRLHDRATRLGRFRHYVNLRRNESKVERLLGDFRFGTLGEVLDSCESRGVRTVSSAELGPLA